MRAMHWLDVPLPDSLVDAQVFGARVHFGPHVMEARLDERVAVLVTRSRFDQFLLLRAQECGAEVVWKEVTSIEAGREGVLVSTEDTECVGRCVILCEGAVDRLSRIVRKPDRPHECGFCVEADVPVAKPQTSTSTEDLVTFYFGMVEHGYGWVFDHGSYRSVGVGGLYSRFESPLAMFREFLAQRGLAAENVRPTGHFVPCGGIERRVCSDRIILAGDAAGFVDSFLGEGLAYAIRSGQLAAEVALAAARQDDFSSSRLALYDQRCRREFGASLRRSLLFTRMVHAWPSLFLRMLASDEKVLRKYLLVPSAAMSYRRYAAWLVARVPLFLLRSSFGRCGRGPA